jgi:hypothetical protein
MARIISKEGSIHSPPNSLSLPWLTPVKSFQTQMEHGEIKLKQQQFNKWKCVKTALRVLVSYVVDHRR